MAGNGLTGSTSYIDLDSLCSVDFVDEHGVVDYEEVGRVLAKSRGEIRYATDAAGYALYGQFACDFAFKPVRAETVEFGAGVDALKSSAQEEEATIDLGIGPDGLGSLFAEKEQVRDVTVSSVNCGSRLSTCYLSLFKHKYRDYLMRKFGVEPDLLSLLAVPARYFRSNSYLHKVHLLDRVGNCFDLINGGCLSFRDYVARMVKWHSFDRFGPGIVARFWRFRVPRLVSIPDFWAPAAVRVAKAVELLRFNRVESMGRFAERSSLNESVRLVEHSVLERAATVGIRAVLPHRALGYLKLGAERAGFENSLPASAYLLLIGQLANVVLFTTLVFKGKFGTLASIPGLVSLLIISPALGNVISSWMSMLGYVLMKMAASRYVAVWVSDVLTLLVRSAFRVLIFPLSYVAEACFELIAKVISLWMQALSRSVAGPVMVVGLLVLLYFRYVAGHLF